VQQYRALAVVIFEGSDPQPDFTHAWFPRCAFDAADVDGRAAFARSGNGLLALLADRRIEPISRGPSAGCELRLPGRSGRWILRLGDTGAHGDLAGFRARFGRLALRETGGGRFVVDDPDYGAVWFEADGTVTAEGRRLDPGGWSIAGRRSITRPGDVPAENREEWK
jgi:hypothetical protein